jgi:hypothetical protein
MTLLQPIFRLNILNFIVHIGAQNLLSFTYIKNLLRIMMPTPEMCTESLALILQACSYHMYGHENRNIFFRANLNFTTVCTVCTADELLVGI